MSERGSLKFSLNKKKQSKTFLLHKGITSIVQIAFSIPTMSFISDKLAVGEEMLVSHVAEVVVVIGGGVREGVRRGGRGRQAACMEPVNSAVFPAESPAAFSHCAGKQ